MNPPGEHVMVGGHLEHCMSCSWLVMFLQAKRGVKPLVVQRLLAMQGGTVPRARLNVVIACFNADWACAQVVAAMAPFHVCPQWRDLPVCCDSPLTPSPGGPPTPTQTYNTHPPLPPPQWPRQYGLQAGGPVPATSGTLGRDCGGRHPPALL